MRPVHLRPFFTALVPLCLAIGTTLPAQSPKPPALAAIRVTDIRRDMDFLGGDHFRGREGGTLDEMRASMWIAEQLRAIGLEPAGEDGTFFQWFSIRRQRLSDASTIHVDGQPVTLWQEAVVMTATDASIDLPLLYVGAGTDADLAGKDLQGKAVAALLRTSLTPPRNQGGVAVQRMVQGSAMTQARALIQKGAAAVILVADSAGMVALPYLVASQSRGSYAVATNETGTPRPRAAAPIAVVSTAALSAVQHGARVAMRLSTESFLYPSVNIVGKIRGTDPLLREEHVLFSSHQDHDGVRGPVDGDSIYNGADDNTSVTVGLFAIARAWKQKPGKRSALFVWHGAEERGLLGSRWHAEHPMVPTQSIVAVLNADMIGRNHPDSAAILGIQPPHRNSAALAQMALDANTAITKFVVDSTWDRPTHVEGWYFRSDHLPYARAGIPALMYSTLLHADYHTPRDEPSRIDAQKLARMAQWMYATGWYVSETRERPGVDPGFRLER